MAHIFKYPTSENKGIMVLTHKELFFLGYQTGDTYRELRYHDPRNYVKRWKYNKKIQQLKEKYLIGIHRGRRLTDVVTPWFVDFHMCGKGTISFQGNPFVIPLASRNFIPSFVKEQGKEKYRDILCVAKNKKLKHNMDFLYAMRKIYDAGHTYKALLICPSNRNETSKGYATELLATYHQLFSSQEKAWFSIMKLDPEVGFYGLSQETLTYFYNVSKVFTLFSELEGESRVIAEALLCKMPVVVYDQLQGGGRDYLDSTNSIQFPSYEKSHEALIQAVEKYASFDINSTHLSQHMHEHHSLERLDEYFETLYTQAGQIYDHHLINTNNLDKRLPAHYRDKKIIRSKPIDSFGTTGDIASHHQFSTFWQHCMQ